MMLVYEDMLQDACVQMFAWGNIYIHYIWNVMYTVQGVSSKYTVL